MKLLTGFPRASLEAVQQHRWYLGCFIWSPTRSHVHKCPSLVSWGTHNPNSPVNGYFLFSNLIRAVWLPHHGFCGRVGDVWCRLFRWSGQSGFDLYFNSGFTLPLTASKPLPRWEQPTFKIKTQTLRKAKNHLVMFPVQRGGAVTWIMIN